MSRAGGGVTGGSSVWAAGTGARTAGGAFVVGVLAARVARVVVGRGAVVVTTAVAAVVVVGATVVVVVADVVVDDGGGNGRSAAATWSVSTDGVNPAGEAPANVETPTSTAARSGLATTGLVRIARIAG